MFRIVCDPSSGIREMHLTEIIGSGSLMFVVCLVGVWQRNFEPVVCVYSTMGWDSPLDCTHTHTQTHHWFRITLPNTDQAHDKHLWTNLTLITNLMHWLLFVHKTIFSSTCFEPQLLIFRKIQLCICSICYCHSVNRCVVEEARINNNNNNQCIKLVINV